jgi:hypothetical protein
MSQVEEILSQLPPELAAMIDTQQVLDIAQHFAAQDMTGLENTIDSIATDLEPQLEPLFSSLEASPEVVQFVDLLAS